MIYDADRKTATPGAHSRCPLCDSEVLAKCGQIVIWHWAHVRNECDPWAEPESEWHLLWKRYLESRGAQIEVVMGEHRADAVMPDGRIVELQAHYQDVPKIQAREAFYGDQLSWIYRAHWIDQLHWGSSSPEHRRWPTAPWTRRFWWKHGSRAMVMHQRPVWWDGDWKRDEPPRGELGGTLSEWEQWERHQLWALTNGFVNQLLRVNLNVVRNLSNTEAFAETFAKENGWDTLGFGSARILGKVLEVVPRGWVHGQREFDAVPALLSEHRT